MSTPGFPGYFVVLVIGALGPSALLFPSALPVINWRALSLTLFFNLLTSLLWEATLGSLTAGGVSRTEDARRLHHRVEPPAH